jgi:hypothetical protein
VKLEKQPGESMKKRKNVLMNILIFFELYDRKLFVCKMKTRCGKKERERERERERGSGRKGKLSIYEGRFVRNITDRVLILLLY